MVRLFEMFEQSYVFFAEDFGKQNTANMKKFKPQNFINKIETVTKIIRQATFPGEKHGAQLALERLVAAAQDIAQELPSATRNNFLAHVNRLTAEFKNVEPIAKAPPKTYDFKMPDATEVMIYVRPNTGLIAGIKKVHYTSVKRSNQDTLYYNIKMEVKAKDDAELHQMMENLGWETTNDGATYWSDDYDRFTSNWRGKAVAQPLTAAIDVIQQKMHDYGLVYHSTSKIPPPDDEGGW